MPSPSRGGIDASPSLVVRFAPELGESLRGYLLRLSEANGYPHLGWAGQGVWPSFMVGRLGGREASSLAALVRLDPAALGVLGSVWTRKGEALLLPGLAVPTFLMDRSRPKVCPACLGERAVLPAVWDLGFWIACPIHECGMLDTCPACRRPLDWGTARARVDRCCGHAPFRGHRTAAAPEAAVD